jgi:hypothetical protein
MNNYNNIKSSTSKFYFNLIDGVYNENNNNNEHYIINYKKNIINIIHIDNNIDNDRENKKVYISLQDAKKMYGFNTENPFERGTFYTLLHERYSHFKYNYIEQLYFHYILVIGNYTHINNWLIKYIDNHSIEQLETILNTPISVPIDFNNKKNVYYLYPITTYSMWNNDPTIIRLMISFGANVYTCDNYGYYPEESLQYISYFHPIPCLKPFTFTQKDTDIDMNSEDNDIYFYRNMDEFIDVIGEIKYVAGEDISHNWVYPI